jgi:hypothetical protein
MASCLSRAKVMDIQLEVTHYVSINFLAGLAKFMSGPKTP